MEVFSLIIALNRPVGKSSKSVSGLEPSSKEVYAFLKFEHNCPPLFCPSPLLLPGTPHFLCSPWCLSAVPCFPGFSQCAPLTNSHLESWWTPDSAVGFAVGEWGPWDRSVGSGWTEGPEPLPSKIMVFMCISGLSGRGHCTKGSNHVAAFQPASSFE